MKLILKVLVKYRLLQGPQLLGIPEALPCLCWLKYPLQIDSLQFSSVPLQHHILSLSALVLKYITLEKIIKPNF